LAQIAGQSDYGFSIIPNGAKLNTQSVGEYVDSSPAIHQAYRTDNLLALTKNQRQPW